ncbi:MAG: hypothetical protein IKW85_06050 [Muribaculaceae bacterium]|nr:hypothetical protein [Muribaculaceae bacterium]
MSSSMRLFVTVLIAFMTWSSHAQFVRTTCFMEGTPYRLQLNPALVPDRGYINVPIVGMSSAGTRSNALSAADVIDMFKNGDDDDYYATDKFYGSLREVSKANVNVSTDLLNVGWWHTRNSFMTFHVGTRVDGNVRVPRELFTFLRDMKGMNSNDYSRYYRNLSNEELNINAFTEIGLGYTRLIGDRVSIGGRVKALLGHGNLKLKINEAAVKTNLVGLDPNYDWSMGDPTEVLNATGTASIEASADLECSFEGLDLITNDQGYIERAEFKLRETGVAGLGAALDFGLAVNVTPELRLSAAVNDLGFIHWSKGCTQVAHAQTDVLQYDSENPGDLSRFSGIVNNGESINLHLLRLTPDKNFKSGRKTMLTSMLAFGCDYMLIKNKLSLGALYTNRFSAPDHENELTFSVNYHPRSLLDFSLSCSPVMSGGSSFGLAVKLGPLFVGTDYMYLGKNTKCCNAMVGLSIPLGRRPGYDDD